MTTMRIMSRGRLLRLHLRFYCMVVVVVILTALYFHFQFFIFHVISHHDHDRHHHHGSDLLLMGLSTTSVEKNSNSNSNNSTVGVGGETVTTAPAPNHLDEQPAQIQERCAINLYGLPRALESIVLPSLIENVIQPNAEYHCDYFIHYYNLTSEIVGRFGQGGRDVNPQEILLVRDKVLEQHQHNDSHAASTVVYGVTQEDDFWQQYATLLKKIHNTKDGNKTGGRYLYFPWKAQTYQFPTTVDNIIKMWHSIQSVWNLMERHANAATTSIKYTRVAMLRSDVFYLTPIDIWAEARGASPSNGSGGLAAAIRHRHHKRNVANNQVVIPGFGKHPVSDRLIYGPYEAVKLWATTRFSSMEAHAQYMHEHNPGWAMHSERFVQREILSRIEHELTGFQVMEHDDMCFFRARVDESVWITDCGGDPRNSIVIPTLPHDIKSAVERILGRSCGDIVQVTGRFKALQCPKKKKILAKGQE